MPKVVFSEPYAVLLAFLKNTRKSAGVTQVELARRLKRPQPFISYIERGERRVDLIEFCAIMRALGVEPGAAFLEVLAKLPAKIDIS